MKGTKNQEAFIIYQRIGIVYIFLFYILQEIKRAIFIPPAHTDTCYNCRYISNKHSDINKHLYNNSGKYFYTCDNKYAYPYHDKYTNFWSDIYSTTASTVVFMATKIAAGGYCSLAFKGDGSLWGAGDNYFGNFGNANNEDTNIFIQISTDILSMAAGNRHIMILKKTAHYGPPAVILTDNLALEITQIKTHGHRCSQELFQYQRERIILLLSKMMALYGQPAEMDILSWA